MPARQSSATVIVAIDGPGASGKSSTARALAKLLDFLYVDTGAMYRSLAWYCLVNAVDVNNPRSVGAACKRWRTSLAAVDGQVQLLVGGKFPGDAIRTPAVTEAASKVAVVPAVRQWMKLKQRECRTFGNIVMEGRDIGTNVFPKRISNSSSTPRPKSAPNAAPRKACRKTSPSAITATASAAPRR